MNVLLVCAMALCSAAEVDDLDAFFKEFADSRDALHAMQGRFTQKSIAPDEISTAFGSVTFIKPRRLIFRFESPATVNMVDGQDLYEYDPEFKQLDIYDLKDQPETEALFLGFEDTTERLRETYEVSFLEVRDMKGIAKGLSLLPKTNGEEPGLFREVKLFLREGDYLPVRIELRMDEETFVHYLIEDIRVNGPITPEDSQIALPEGAEIIRDDELVETVGPEGKRVPDALLPKPTE